MNVWVSLMDREKRLKAVTLGLALLGLVLVLKADPFCVGDGPEYLLQVFAIANHGTPDIRSEDVDSLIRQSSKFRIKNFDPTYFMKIQKEIQLGKEEVSITQGDSTFLAGIFKSNNGKYFGYHFFSYAYMVAPLKVMLDSVGANPFKALQILNYLIFLGTIGICIFFGGFGLRLNVMLALLYIGSGMTFYLGWSHPEVLIGSGFFLATLFLINRRYGFAILVSVIASLQNPVAIIIGIAAALLGLSEVKARKKLLERAAAYFALGSLSVIPFIFYFMNFSKFSLIASAGYMRSSNVSVGRFFEIFFDPNIGLICGMPCILLALPPVLFLCARRQQRLKPIEGTHQILAAAFSISAAALIFSAQTNWNPGQAVYVRYAMYLGLQMILILTLLAAQLRWGNAILSIVLIGQAINIIGYGVYTNFEQLEYLSHKRLPQLIFRYAPSLYNPDPEIFIERNAHKEVYCEMETSSAFKYKDRIWKAIVNKRRLPQVLSCVNKSGVDFSISREAKCSFQGWVYINFPDGLGNDICL